MKTIQDENKILFFIYWAIKCKIIKSLVILKRLKNQHLNTCADSITLKGFLVKPLNLNSLLHLTLRDEAETKKI